METEVLEGVSGGWAVGWTRVPHSRVREYFLPAQAQEAMSAALSWCPQVAGAQVASLKAHPSHMLAIAEPQSGWWGLLWDSQPERSP